MAGGMYVVRELVARHRDYVLVDWAPSSRGIEYDKSWIPKENVSVEPGSNSITIHSGWFNVLPEMQAEDAVRFPGLGQ
jgi:hypothetical protein